MRENKAAHPAAPGARLTAPAGLGAREPNSCETALKLWRQPAETSDSFTATPSPRQRGTGEPRWPRPLGRTFERRRASSFSASPSANPVGVRKRMFSAYSHKLLLAALSVACLLVLAPS